MSALVNRAASLSFMVLFPTLLLFGNEGKHEDEEPRVVWTPHRLSAQVFPGGTRLISVSFRVEGELEDIQVVVSARLQPFVSVDRNRFADIDKHEAQHLNLTLRVPVGITPGTEIEGAIHLKGHRRTLEEVLPVEVNVTDVQPAINKFQAFLLKTFGTLRPPDSRLRGDLPPDVSAAFKAGTDDLVVLTHESPDLIVLASDFTTNGDLKFAVDELLTKTAARGVRIDDLRATLEDHLLFHKNIDDTGGKDIITLFGAESGLYTRPAVAAPLLCKWDYTAGSDFIYLVNCTPDGHIELLTADANELISMAKSNGSFTAPNGRQLLSSAETALHELSHAMFFRTKCFSGSIKEEEDLMTFFQVLYSDAFFGDHVGLAKDEGRVINLRGSGCMALLGLSSSSCLPMDDSFDAPSLNMNHWEQLIPPSGFAGTAIQRNQRLEITASSGTGGAGIVTTGFVTGDFDVQVDYALITWPPRNAFGLRLAAVDLSSGRLTEVAIQRNSSTISSSEFYTMVFPTNAQQTPTTDRAGKLRLVRIGSNLSGWFCHSTVCPASLDGTNWVMVGSSQVEQTATRFSLDLGSIDRTPPGGILVAFDNFRLNSGTAFCATR